MPIAKGKGLNMYRLVLLRHGQSTWNMENRFTGWRDVDLSDKGREEAREAGATIGRQPAATFWGGYSGVFIDPEGHPWEVAHNPRWTLTDDGGVQLS